MWWQIVFWLQLHDYLIESVIELCTILLLRHYMWWQIVFWLQLHDYLIESVIELCTILLLWHSIQLLIGCISSLVTTNNRTKDLM